VKRVDDLESLRGNGRNGPQSANRHGGQSHTRQTAQHPWQSASHLLLLSPSAAIMPDAEAKRTSW
jgi:hypothetical protein